MHKAQRGKLVAGRLHTHQRLQLLLQALWNRRLRVCHQTEQLLEHFPCSTHKRVSPPLACARRLHPQAFSPPKRLQQEATYPPLPVRMLCLAPGDQYPLQHWKCASTRRCTWLRTCCSPPVASCPAPQRLLLHIHKMQRSAGVQHHGHRWAITLQYIQQFYLFSRHLPQQFSAIAHP